MKPLLFCNNVEVCKIKDIIGGKTLNQRLIDLGLNKGSDVKVIRNEGGRLIVLVGETRIAIGQGMAHKIMVFNKESVVTKKH